MKFVVSLELIVAMVLATTFNGSEVSRIQARASIGKLLMTGTIYHCRCSHFPGENIHLNTMKFDSEVISNLLGTDETLDKSH